MTPNRSIIRWLLLLVVLLAYARLAYHLGTRDLWLDEAFSLQRAEADWPSLITGGLKIADAPDAPAVTDPHPFGFYALLKLVVGLLGSSEFALRYAALSAMVLLIPTAWVLARLLTRRRVTPPTTPVWVFLVVAFNPFYLWYGQEARMYAQVAWLATLSTYALLRWLEAVPGSRPARRWLSGYTVSILLLLGSHFFSILILPVHALVAYLSLVPTSRRRALWTGGGILALALVPGLVAVWLVVHEPGAVGHFASVGLPILLIDLVSAFSVGLSMDATPARWIGLAVLAFPIIGSIYAWSRRWFEPALAVLLPLWIVTPVLLLAAINLWRPAYMTARELTLVSSAYLLTASAGLAWLWQRWRALTMLVAVGLLGVTLYSTINYYRSPVFDKGDLSGMGDYLRQELRPGDLVLIEPSSWWRMFEYYLPWPEVTQGADKGLQTGWEEIGPPANDPAAATADLERWNRAYRRIWLARGREQSPTSQWLQAHNCRIWDLGFESPISYLRLELFQSQAPIPDQLPDTIQHRFDAVFGGELRLLGYDVGQAVSPEAAVPVTLYWQAVTPLTRHDKYKIALSSAATGERVTVTEREPFDGCWPTTRWPPGSIVVEQTGLHAPGVGRPDDYRLTFQVYDADTLDLLPVTQAQGIAVEADGLTLIAPAPVRWPQ